MSIDTYTLRVIREVTDERGRQLQKFGVQNWEPRDWLMILAEEVGEANREALEARFANVFPEHYAEDAQRMQRLRAELIQVAAVAVAAVESLDRNELKDANPTIYHDGRRAGGMAKRTHVPRRGKAGSTGLARIQVAQANRERKAPRQDAIGL